MRIGAAYIRVSTDDQMELSPDSQLKKIKDYAQSHDIILTNDFIFMETEGRSGRSAKKRPEFQRMIGFAKAKPKPFDVILVWKFSRFARSREDSVVYKSMLRKQCKIDVISVSEYTGDDKMSILIEAIIEAMDEYYSINLAGEVLRGMTEKAERGGLVGSPAYGYYVKDGKLVPDEKQAEIVRLIFADFVQGAGCHTIATKLNSMGLRTRRGRLWENRVIDYIIHNPVYIGKTRWSPNGHIDRDFDKEGIILTEGTHEAIISKEVFEAAQERIGEIQRIYRPYRRDTKHGACMLQGLVRCSSCGSTLVRTGKGLQCHSYSHGKCSVSHYVSIERINPIVLQQINDDFTQGFFHLNIRQAPVDVDPNLFVKQQLDKAAEKYDRIKEAYEAGVYTLEEYKTSRKKIEDEIEQLKAQFVPQKQQPPEVTKRIFLEKNRSTLNALKNPELSEEEKNGLLHSFIERIVYNRKTNSITIFYYC